MIFNILKRFPISMSKKYISLILIIVFLLITELYSSWIEYLMGQLLLFGNASRPESGLIWEIKHKKQTANDQLIKLINNRFSIQDGSVSFSRILKSLSEGKGVMISCAHFMDFYKQLPFSVSKKIFSPYLILKTSLEQMWDRTYFEKKINKIHIYLLDQNNTILEQSIVDQYMINFDSMIRPKFNGTINDLPNFKNNIYSSNIFFSALVSLPKNIQNKIFFSPEKLININGDILKVGISNKTKANITEIGIEIEDDQGLYVVFFEGESKAINIIKKTLNKNFNSLNSNTNFTINR